MFESSYSQILQVPTKYLHRRFIIRFKGEEGIDYGGVTREWLYLLSHSMLGTHEITKIRISELRIFPRNRVITSRSYVLIQFHIRTTFPYKNKNINCYILLMIYFILMKNENQSDIDLNWNLEYFLKSRN